MNDEHTPTPDQIRAVFSLYAQALSAGDTRALVELFAPEGVLEDPIGTEPHRGHAAIAAFFDDGFRQTGGRILFRAEGPVRINGAHGACAFVATCDRATPPFEVDTIDIGHFDRNAKLLSMVAIVGPSNFRPLAPR